MNFRPLRFVFAWALLICPVFAQGETLLHEDFEGEAPGWTFENFESGLWHLTSAHNCLGENKMAAYSAGLPMCNYYKGEGIPGHGYLQSPEIRLTGLPPYVISFEYAHEVDSSDSTCFQIWDLDAGEADPWICEVMDNSGSLNSFSWMLPPTFPPIIKRIALRFEFTADGESNQGLGWWLDNVDVRNSGTVPPPIVEAEGIHYLRIQLPEPGDLADSATALRIDSPSFSGAPKYLNASGEIVEEPFYQSFVFWNDLLVSNELINPSTSYDVATFTQLPVGGFVFSNSGSDQTWRLGDLDHNGIVNLNDILHVLAAFFGDFDSVSLEAADQAGPDGAINVADILAVLWGFSK